PALFDAGRRRRRQVDQRRRSGQVRSQRRGIDAEEALTSSRRPGMKPLDEQMSIYLRYHRNPKNRLTHFVGVPLIMFSLFVLFGMVKFVVAGFAISAATILAVVVLVYYFRLDVVLAAAMTLFVAVLLLIANQVVAEGAVTALVVFGVTFVGGWIL